jgi:hypothetical protein
MSKISDKLAKMRGEGQAPPLGLEEILMDIEKRLEALEPKKADQAQGVKSKT